MDDAVAAESLDLMYLSRQAIADFWLFEANHAAFPDRARPVLEQLAALRAALTTFREAVEEACSAAPTDEAPVPGGMASPALQASYSSSLSSPRDVIWID